MTLILKQMTPLSFKPTFKKPPIFPPILIQKFISSSSLKFQSSFRNPSRKPDLSPQNCTNLPQLLQLHAHIIKSDYLESKISTFHYNNVIRSYTRLNSPNYALNVYLIMRRNGVSPDNYTIPIAIKAVGQFCSLRLCRGFHCVAIRCGLGFDEYVESGIVSMYVKWGDFRSAFKVFDESPGRNVGLWNAIISGFSKNGRLSDVMSMFVWMRRSGVVPDCVTMVSVFSACGGLGDLGLAQQLHKFVFQVNVRRNEDVSMVNSVIDMYGKCGRMDLAEKVFNEMELRNVSSWTSMIVGYANHGGVKEAMGCFLGMIEANVMPNHVTFVGVLSACVHGGMVKEGRHWFDAMKTVYGIKPRLKHYGCMVDLLGRAGLLSEAREIVEEMPMKPNGVIWGCLLGACEKYNNVKIGEWVADNFLELEPWNDGVYVVLSNIYANRAMWEEVERIRQVMKQRRLFKFHGFSSSTTLH